MLASLFSRMDPRRSLAAAIGWLTILMSMSLALAASGWVGKVVRATLIEQHSLRLASTADYIASQLDLALTLRLQSVSIASAMVSQEIASNPHNQLQHVLANVQHSFPDFLWIGATDPDGQVIAATDAHVVGTNAHEYAWFSQGLIIDWIEEGVDFNTPDYPRTGKGQRFLKLTAPIRNENGGVLGVVAARLDWAWVLELAANIDRGLAHVSREQWLLVDRDDVVRIGPEEFVGQKWDDSGSPVSTDSSKEILGAGAAELPDRLMVKHVPSGKTFLIANADQDDADSLQKLGWRVVVIQPVSAVTLLATRVQWQIVMILLGLGIATAVLGGAVARRLMRRVRSIARSADAVLAGQAAQIEVPGGQDEAARLGQALDRLLTALQKERDDLKQLNAELDQRVAARTQEIERLAGEARYSAVVRERLKIARDLHDTLAHSMMAMLTEIRLLKKLAATKPEALADELAQAEQAAHQGLQEARAAITQMRYNAARDVGLGAALSDVVRLFSERTGIECDYQVDPEVATFSEERAETLFRIAEEALRNVERHSGANRAVVALRSTYAGKCVSLSIADDGVGFSPDATVPGHFGLIGLKEQAQLIGATLDIQSLPQQGTTVTVTLRI